MNYILVAKLFQRATLDSDSNPYCICHIHYIYNLDNTDEQSLGHFYYGRLCLEMQYSAQ